MSTPRLWALGSELDDLGSSSGRGKALRRVGGKKKCAPLLGLAKSIYLYADSPWLSGSLTDTEWDSNFLDCTLIVWKYGLHFLLNNNNNNNNNNNHNSNWVCLVELSTKKSLMNLLNGVCPVKGVGGGLHTSSKLFRDGSRKSGRCKSGHWHKRKNLQILNLQILAALFIH